MTAQSPCVVVGYASIDHKYDTAAFEGPGRTTLVRQPLQEGRPVPGAVSYFALGLAANDIAVEVVSWVGDDANGEVFVDTLAGAGVGIEAIARSGTRSPTSHMYYPEGAEPVLFFDPGDLDQSLTARQREAIAGADGVLIGVGPATATAAALGAVAPGATLMWAVKSDPASIPPELARALAQRADVICHSESERGFLEEICGLDLAVLEASGTLVVQTCGSRGARARRGDEVIVSDALDPVGTPDATGAGDTFAAGLMARFLRLDERRTQDIQRAITGACTDAHALLRSRIGKGEDG